MNALQTLRRSLLTSTAVAAVLVAGFAPPASADLGDANPLIAVQASASGFPAGSLIFGSAVLGQGNAPTGTIAFTLHGPSDPTCAAAPLFTSSVLAVGNGYYASATFLALSAGTYRWRVQYLGDDNNNPTAVTACADPGAAVTVAKRSPNLGSTASASAAGVTNTATLLSGSGPVGPTGTLTFSLYAAGNMICAGSPIFTSVKPVAGNGTYSADPFVPTVAGTYQWTVRYSGDLNNNAAGTGCADPANAVTVSAVAKAATVTATPSTLRAYEPLTVTWSNIAAPTPGDWFALYAVGAPDGIVLLWRYTGGSANGSMTVTVPWGTKAGSYEIRLFANNSVQRLDVSDLITVW